jgi:MurNAc alpha-1-phosphate uridylyltransferase
MSEVKNPPYKAFILAAGFGTRLRPITNLLPKPMVEVNGRSLLWRTLDNLREYGTRYVVVNAHYLSDLIEAHIEEYMKEWPEMRVHVSFEEGVLDTGGGVRHALAHFGEDEPFFVIAGDNLWVDNENDTEVTHTYKGALESLASGWNAQEMDIFTLMQPISRMRLTKGVGDYDLFDDGKVHRSLDKTGSYMWTNIRLNHPRIYQNIDREAFSFLELMDEAERTGRFYALEYSGEWHHISMPEDLKAVDAHMRRLENSKKGEE